jgi:hypothetical protein
VGLGELLGIALAFLVLDIFFVSYRWIRDALGDVEPDLIPAARVAVHAKHRGFRGEPTWLRPFQAVLLALGLTGTIITAVTFLGVAGVMFLV